ncbi:hypothetical protein A3F59_01950 [Candidatus Roizmanbacteria bacterium RIFCSPHIGHO2_12_FULL_38_13]|nr:MAG: hypothetical protein A2905_03880 [Candidatus Levybacteria bacterium RIFCSPLOWO2_01_FULL_36_10]OGK35683.1 MAG: hypothetical protein A3F59_01950 [Candidatus Roizmanbacteria bacterium RIFCSPHIGHO2_12_FULL_38_13]
MGKSVIKASRDNLRKVPTMIGVYIFEKNDRPIYIGKSINLKARLISHFESAKIDSKTANYVYGADKISYFLTDSEFKALLLESKLIQSHKPKYNVRWRDDKSYLYIKVTIKDTYPKFFINRKEDNKNAKYFGPFQSVRVASNILREIRKIFPFCTQKKITKQRCFYSKIKLCNPCPNMIEKIADPTLQLQEKKRYKSNIRQAIKVLKGNIEVVSKDLYRQIELLTKQKKFEEAIPYRNRLYRLEGLVSHQRFDTDQDEYYNMSEKFMNGLEHLLKQFFPTINNLSRIECYDISNLNFENATASMVVFTNGLSDKKEYKRFKIKNKKAQSDFEMIEEVIERRLKHKSWKWPDLLVIDGGKPQVRSVLKVMKKASSNIPMIGIAKRPDRLIIATDNLFSIRPPSGHPGFKLLQALRDESHRFARSYHLKLRRKKML